MKTGKWTDHGVDGRAVLARALLFALLWWALTDEVDGAWWVGVPAVVVTSVLSVALVPPTGLVWRQALGFIPFFLWLSLKGGMDVAWRAFHPRMPITPELIEFPLQLPAGLPRVVLLNTVSMLPGTLSTQLENRVLRVHVLDSSGDFLDELEKLEQRVGGMFKCASSDLSRR